MSVSYKHRIRIGLWALGLTLALGFNALHSLGFGVDPVRAQRSPKALAVQVYEQLPDFPRENHYIRKETNKPASNSTLISRLIQYHTYVKGRSPQYRLDWKITLADYLGFNERVLDETYPGRDFLKSNPINSDLKILQQLNRAQRATLIQALVDVHRGSSARRQPTSAEPQPSPAVPSTTPKPPPGSTLQPLEPPGRADLLRFPTAAPPSTGTQPQGEAQKLLLP